MNSIIQHINHAYAYLAENVHNQTQTRNSENEFYYQTITVTVAICGAILGMCVKKCMNTVAKRSRPIEDTPELFWQEVEQHQRPPLPLGPVIIMGKVVASDLGAIQKQMFLSCTRPSLLFMDYLQTKELKPKTVMDLGCGLGANSSFLLKQGVKVVAIDKMEYLLEAYRSRIGGQERQLISFQCEDMIHLEKYTPQDHVVDVVLAIDVMPYLPTSSWKETLKKITASLKPGGYFFCTLFIKKERERSLVVDVHEKFGANYYPIHDLAARLIRHSGFEMVECRLKEGGEGCYEFVARKPITLTQSTAA